MNEIITALIAALGSTGATAIILAILQRKWANIDKKNAIDQIEDKKLDAVVDGLKVLMVDRVRYLGQKYIDQHEISLEEKENLNDMHEAYKKLSGDEPDDGKLDIVMAEVNRLPITDQRIR